MRIGVGLSIPELATRGGRFSPASLFTSGVAGAWYDPSDYTTLFTDAAGTTPVTAVEQPVRLMLDKSQGLVLGSEATSGAWLNAYTTTFDTFTSTGPSSFTATTTGAKSPRVAVLASLPTAGWYWIEFTATFTGGSFSTVGVSNTGSPYSAAVATTVLPTTGVAFRTLIYTSAAREYLTVTFNATGASTLSVTGVSVKSYAGNHALAPNDLSRPVLRARYNQLTYSEQFDNAAWSKATATVTANATTAPDGTTTADSIRADNTAYPSTFVTVTTVASTSYTLSIYAKSNTTSQLSMEFRGAGGTPDAVFNLSSGTVTSGTGAIVSVGNGWYRCSITKTSVDASEIAIIGLGFAPAVNDSIYIWGAQLVTGSSAGTYQRIAAATDYATAGFLPYLYFVTDDSFGTNSINFSATDKMSVCAGVTKLSDAAAQIVCELSATSSAGNNGSFAIISALSPSNYAFYLYGNALASRTATTYASPVTNVVSVKYDISQSTVPNEIAPQINGAVPTLADAGGAGTGNFGNYPLYIGRRNNASLPFEGRIYQLIVCGKALSASELASTEAYVNSKTGAY